jgi:hypothetical protein
MEVVQVSIPFLTSVPDKGVIHFSHRPLYHLGISSAVLTDWLGG